MPARVPQQHEKAFPLRDASAKLSSYEPEAMRQHDSSHGVRAAHHDSLGCSREPCQLEELQGSRKNGSGANASAWTLHASATDARKTVQLAQKQRARQQNTCQQASTSYD